MKIRNGFVSNSSSSSFCIYGTCVDMDELLEKVKSTSILSEEELERVDELIENDESYEVVEMLEEKVDGLVFHSDYENDQYYIGRNWSSVEDDETGKEFKNNVKEELEKLLGPDVELETYDEEIYS